MPAGIVKPNYADDRKLYRFPQMGGSFESKELTLSAGETLLSARGDPKYSFLERRGNAKPKELESWEQEGMRRVCRVSSHRTAAFSLRHRSELFLAGLQLSREVLDHAASFIRPGITTNELGTYERWYPQLLAIRANQELSFTDAIVHQACIDRGAYPSPLNYRNFPKSVCTSVNEVICHGIPDFRPLQEGDIVNLDVSLYYGG